MISLTNLRPMALRTAQGRSSGNASCLLVEGMVSKAHTLLWGHMLPHSPTPRISNPTTGFDFDPDIFTMVFSLLTIHVAGGFESFAGL